MYVPLYKRVWFWVMVALLTGAVGILKWQMIARAADEEAVIRNAVQQAYFDIMTKRGEDMVARQKADTYGGDTPEETLRLFVEALEKKDYELASKYYVVEEQEKALNQFEKMTNENIKFYLNVLSFKNEVKYFPDKQDVNVDFFLNNEQVHFERLKLNSLTNKWKLTEK